MHTGLVKKYFSARHRLLKRTACQDNSKTHPQQSDTMRNKSWSFTPNPLYQFSLSPDTTAIENAGTFASSINFRPAFQSALQEKVFSLRDY